MLFFDSSIFGGLPTVADRTHNGIRVATPAQAPAVVEGATPWQDDTGPAFWREAGTTNVMAKVYASDGVLWWVPIRFAVEAGLVPREVAERVLQVSPEEIALEQSQKTKHSTNALLEALKAMNEQRAELLDPSKWLPGDPDIDKMRGEFGDDVSETLGGIVTGAAGGIGSIIVAFLRQFWPFIAAGLGVYYLASR